MLRLEERIAEIDQAIKNGHTELAVMKEKKLRTDYIDGFNRGEYGVNSIIAKTMSKHIRSFPNELWRNTDD